MAGAGLATFGGAVLGPVFHYQMALELLFGAVAAVAWYGGVGPGMLTAVLGFGTAAWLFVEPARTWPALDPPHLKFTGFYFLVTSAIVLFSHLLYQARNKRADAEAHERERQERKRVVELETLMNAAPAAIMISRDAGSLRIVGNSAAYALLRGRPGTNLSRSAPLDEQSTDYRVLKDGIEVPVSELPMQKAAATGQPVRDYEADLLFPGGVRLTSLGNAMPLLDESGCPYGAVGIFVDITARKRTENALKESEERLRLAMEAADEAIWEYDPESGTVRLNEAGVRAYGQPPGDAPCQAWFAERTDPAERERVIRAFMDALNAHQTSWTIEHKFRRVDGSWADVHNRAVIAFDPSNRPIRIVGAVLDITARKRAEQALQDSNRKLMQLSRDLLRTQDYERRRIARELHDSTAQLLVALNINLCRLRDPALSVDRRDQALGEAIQLAESCSTEIRSVTYLLHPPLLEHVGLRGALECYAQGFSHRTGIEVEVKMSSDFGRLDREREAVLFRIVQEGLANVHKHSGSQLAVVRLSRDARGVRLVVRDRGRGIPSTLRQQNGFVGFGVGVLGMTERAKQLGGTLDLASDETGTTLTATLPLVASNEEYANSVGG